MNKRAQGALEFLMTYGWAFLVIIIMVGALAYFGVLDPSKFLPDRCSFGAEVLCKKGEFKIAAHGSAALTDPTIKVTLINQFGSAVVVKKVMLNSDVASIGKACTATNQNGVRYDNVVAPATGYPWPEGQPVLLSVDCGVGAKTLPVGEKVKVSVDIEWYVATGNADFTHTASGDIYTTISAS